MSGFLTHTSPLKADIFQFRALTSGPSFDHTKAPQNSARRSRRLCHTPLCGKKSGFSCFLPPLRPLAFLGLWGCGYILAEQRPGVRETPAALHWPGSVVSAFFCILNPPKQCRCFMHSIPLFRPASCGGRASLSFLLRKLARAGETAALVALLGTSLSTSARVRWAMLGHVLTVVEVRHA